MVINHTDQPGAAATAAIHADGKHHAPTRALVIPFLAGGLSSSFATLCIQPIDFVKVRLQLDGEGRSSNSGRPKPGPFHIARDIISTGRARELYSGLSAALLRQVVYGTSRLGLFFSFEDALQKRARQRETDVTFGQRAVAGVAAGGIAALIGNPAELALIRMQSDGLKPRDQQARYRSVFDAVGRIVRHEGVPALWKGAYPTVVRAMCTNFGQLAFFSESKHRLSRFTRLSDQSRTLTASAIAGFFAAFFSLPFDFVKTRLQKQETGHDGRLRYRGMVDCFAQTAKQEGLLRFYRGFGTYFMRMAPHSVISLFVADNLARWLKKK